MKKIGVISDTHGLLRPEVSAHLDGCDVILHAGDINSPDILNRLRETAPVCAVCGNADTSWAEIEGLPQTRHVEIFGLTIFIIHNKTQIKEDISGCDIVISGHTHKYLEKTEDGTLWLNPGSCGPRRFTMPITMAIIEVEDDGGFTVKKIDIPHPEPKQSKSADSKATKSSGGKVAKASGNTDAKISNSKTTGKGSDHRSDIPADTSLIEAIMHDIDIGKSTAAISKKYTISENLTDQICRLYLTHPGVDAEGIINKMMISGL